LELEFGATIPSIGLKKTDPVVLWLMGLTSVADWIGSDEKHFPVDHGWSVKEGKQSAKLAVESIGLCKPQIKDNLSFKEIFGFNANEMQRKAIAAITKPGIYVIEAPMGLGKTEAALACTYELLQSGRATGLYFALPTQLTSNRIHLRVSKFIEKITKNSDKTRLAHANSWLEDAYYQPRPVRTLVKHPDGDAFISRDWFASAKRALLANFGVGTIDQALMSVVAVKHFFVRRFALAGKVIIIDEVHSYDYFTGTLVRFLCQELQKLGCTIIILSATLLPDVRNELLDVQKEDIQKDNYPLITGKIAEGDLIPAQESKPQQRPAVHRMFKSTQQSFTDALASARQGARVLWVCNTVNSAQEVFLNLSQLKNGFKLGLLHSRFPHFIRQRQEDYWMERLGKNGKAETGCVLVSTQIVEQSVDIDSDILITELAPMDMLLQRMGRLWRHLDARPPNIRPTDNPEIWIIREEKSLNELKQVDSEQLTNILGAKAKVYQPYILLKTYETLCQDCYNSINLADHEGNTDVRNLLQLTYLNREEDPDSWKTLAGDMQGTAFAEKQLAIANTHLFARAALNDEEGKQTRLIEIETIPMLIATNIGADQITLLNGDCIPSKIDVFDIRHARSIHSNIVRVHAWPFEQIDRDSHQALSFYLKKDYCLSLLDGNNQLEIKGLKAGITFQWNETIGVVQTYDGGGTDESSD
jgi:CRISPR-associated endonuclease/helicase Cas3